MKQGRFSESQIVAILKQQDSGQTVAQITREHGVSEATFYNWNGAARAGQVWWYAGFRSQEAKRS
jgi:putative transposase